MVKAERKKKPKPSTGNKDKKPAYRHNTRKAVSISSNRLRVQARVAKKCLTSAGTVRKPAVQESSTPASSKGTPTRKTASSAKIQIPSSSKKADGPLSNKTPSSTPVKKNKAPLKKTPNTSSTQKVGKRPESPRAKTMVTKVISTRASEPKRTPRKTAINARQVIIEAVGIKKSPVGGVKKKLPPGKSKKQLAQKKTMVVATSALFNNPKKYDVSKVKEAKKEALAEQKSPVKNESSKGTGKKSLGKVEPGRTPVKEVPMTPVVHKAGDNDTFVPAKQVLSDSPKSKIRIDLTGAVMRTLPKAKPMTPKNTAVLMPSKKDMNKKATAEKLVNELNITPNQAQRMVATLFQTSPKGEGAVVKYQMKNATKGKTALVKVAEAKLVKHQSLMSPPKTGSKASPVTITVGKAVKHHKKETPASASQLTTLAKSPSKTASGQKSPAKTVIEPKTPTKSMSSPSSLGDESKRGKVASPSPMKDDNPDAKKVLIRCSVCGNLFEPGESFRRHKVECQNAHAKCNKCGEFFPKGNEFTEHQELCTGDGQGIKDEKDVKTWDEIFSNNNTTSLEENADAMYKCMACAEAFPTFKVCREHEEVCGQVASGTPNSVMCSDCKCAFGNRIFLSRHKTQHPGCPGKKPKEKMALDTIPISVKVTLQDDGTTLVDVGAKPLGKENLEETAEGDDHTEIDSKPGPSSEQTSGPIILPTTGHTLKTYGQQPGVRGLSFANDATEILQPQHRQPVVKCPICNKMFKNLSYLKRHFDSFHNLDFDFFIGGASTPGKGAPQAKTDLNRGVCENPRTHRGCSCLDCGEWLPGRLELNLHKRKCSEAGGKKLHPCTLCDQAVAFKSRLDLYEHMRVEHGSQEDLGYIIFSCVVCSAAFSSKQALIDHHGESHNSNGQLLTHEIEGEKSVQCLDCGNFYPLKQLHQHKWVCAEKNKTKSYVCFTCDQAYNTRTQLETHKRENMCGPMVCWQCQQVFTAQVDLLHHITQVHKKTDTSDKSPLLKFSGSRNILKFRTMSPMGALEKKIVKSFDVRKVQGLLKKVGNNSLVVPLSEVVLKKDAEEVKKICSDVDSETEEMQKARMTTALCLQPSGTDTPTGSSGQTEELRCSKRKATSSSECEPPAKCMSTETGEVSMDITDTQPEVTSVVEDIVEEIAATEQTDLPSVAEEMATIVEETTAPSEGLIVEEVTSPLNDSSNSAIVTESLLTEVIEEVAETQSVPADVSAVVHVIEPDQAADVSISSDVQEQVSAPTMLIPLEGNSVMCTKCDTVLATMKEVASHHCLTAKAPAPRMEKIQTDGGNGVEWYVASV